MISDASRELKIKDEQYKGRKNSIEIERIRALVLVMMGRGESILPGLCSRHYGLMSYTCTYTLNSFKVFLVWNFFSRYVCLVSPVNDSNIFLAKPTVVKTYAVGSRISEVGEEYFLGPGEEPAKSSCQHPEKDKN